MLLLLLLLDICHVHSSVCVCVCVGQWTMCCRGSVWWVLWWVWTSPWGTLNSILQPPSAALSQIEVSSALLLTLSASLWSASTSRLDNGAGGCPSTKSLRDPKGPKLSGCQLLYAVTEMVILATMSYSYTHFCWMKLQPKFPKCFGHFL